jgi:DNA-binding NarL/FixJ family response regulator
MKVLVVDDQELVRAGFAAILTRAGLDVVGEAADGLEAVVQATERQPDVVLMDVRMPRLDGIEATRRILATCPRIQVVVLTTFDLDEYVYRAVHAGACGFLLKDIAPDDLVHAVHVAARGDALLAPALTRRLLAAYASGPEPGGESERFAGLTERELDVLRLVAEGRSNAEIAGTLYLSEATVKTYVSRMLTKLDLRDRLQLAVLAYRTVLVRP